MAVEFRSASFAPTSGDGDTTSSRSCARPSGLFVGDLLVAFCGRSQTSAGATGFAASGWTNRGFFPGSSSSTFGPVGILTRTVVASEASSYTFTSPGATATDQFVVHILAFSGASDTDPILVGPTKQDGSSPSASVIAPSLTLPEPGMLACWFSVLDYVSGTTWSPPSQMTERVDRGGIWLHPATYTETRSAGGSTGTRNAVHSTTPEHRARAVSVAIRAAGGPPVVDAGPDATAAQLEPFTRTAVEDDQDLPITSRAWTVVSGPGQAGETVGSAAALSWTPYTPGTYTLRYTATNSAGSGSDDVAVTVTAVDHPVTAALTLAAARAGAKQAAAAPAAALTLTAAVEAGPRQAIGTVTATVRLTAAAAGVRNGVTATMRLTADIGATTSSRAAPAAADPLRLTAAPGDTTTARAGAAAAAGLRLTATILAERIISAVRGVAARPSLAITHELVVVARVPQASGPPALMEVDAVTWSGLSWTDELSKPQTLTAGCKIASLTEPILQRLRAPADLPTEIWLYRNGKLTFAGPLLGAQVQGESLSLTARGLLAYLDFMAIEAPDLVFTQTDQTIMAKTMVDRWQATPYGHFGIDTTGIVPSGVLRDGTYLYREDHKVGRRIVELGARINGFDTAVDPASRQLILAHPRQGQDRSSGEDAVVFDASNITSPNLVWSAAPGDVASDVFGTGTGAATDPVYGHQFNEQLRARFGRTATFATFDGVSEQGTLDDHLAAMRDVRGQIVTVPGPDTRVTPDSDLDGYDVGDTVSYALHELLSVQAPFRLLKRQVTASQTGQEAVSVAFV